MSKGDFAKRLAKFNRPYLRMDLSPGDPGQVPVTKLSGAPWWPAKTARPVCVDGHTMAFIGQFRLDEVPGIEQPPTLLSFHYCEECMYEGKMSFGWQERGRQLRYNVSLFSDLDMPVDGLGTVAKSTVKARRVKYHKGIETLNIEDKWEQFPETAGPNGIPDFDRIAHEDGSKLGGWPSWAQHPIRPEDKMGNEMKFVGQLDWNTCPDSAWNTGWA